MIYLVYLHLSCLSSSILFIYLAYLVYPSSLSLSLSCLGVGDISKTSLYTLAFIIGGPRLLCHHHHHRNTQQKTSCHSHQRQSLSHSQCLAHLYRWHSAQLGPLFRMHGYSHHWKCSRRFQRSQPPFVQSVRHSVSQCSHYRSHRLSKQCHDRSQIQRNPQVSIRSVSR